ncbi:MAG: FAD-dependent oxidoreductase, partial [Elusimicrobia bacterium]|nr:FAD-dependent oxidoreductase [Elusimicrobiota bacterium]
FGNNEYGGFTQKGIDYFARRAQGGFGLLFSGGTNADCVVDGNDGILNHKEEFINTGKIINEELKKYDCKMFIQISMNVGRNGGLKTPSPLPVLSNPKIMTKALTIEEIHTKITEAGQAAKLCKQAGFAGIDIHALHWGHLLDSFALSFMNHRTDEYGGSLENRLRFAKEIVQEIKKECGQDFPVTIRLAIKSYMKDFNKASFDGSNEAGRTVEEAVEIAKLLESYGYDGLSIDAGTLDAFYYAMPPSYIPKGFMIDMAEKIKKVVSIPVLCGGRMADPNIAETAIADKKIDAVVLGRQAIADPDYANKVIIGKQEEIKTCIACNQGCIWGYFTNGKVSCAVNPCVGYEKEYKIEKVKTPKKVIVVGGGVAGMEAAIVATLRGHNVTVYEKSSQLGGNLIPAGAHDFKEEISELNSYYKKQLEQLNIDTKLNTEISCESLLKENADVIILATGSKPVIPKIEGINHKKTISGEDALVSNKAVGEKVVVVGGGLVGCEIAYGYAKEGKKVTVVDALDEIMKLNNVPLMNKAMLLDGFEYYGTEILTNAKLKEINDAGAVVTLNDGQQKTINADSVIISIGYRPVPSLKQDLEHAGCKSKIYEIGDGKKVGNIMTCISDAFAVSFNI